MRVVVQLYVGMESWEEIIERETRVDEIHGVRSDQRACYSTWSLANM